jgi:hypothetical protein
MSSHLPLSAMQTGGVTAASSADRASLPPPHKHIIFLFGMQRILLWIGLRGLPNLSSCFLFFGAFFQKTY